MKFDTLVDKYWTNRQYVKIATGFQLKMAAAAILNFVFRP